MDKPGGSRYDTIWTADHDDDDAERDEFLSETEVDERSLSSPHDKQQQQHHHHHHRRLLLASVRRHRWIIDTSLLLLITVLLVVLLVRQSMLAARLDSGQGAAGRRQVGGDFSHMGGNVVSVSAVKWDADASFVPNNMSEWFSESLVGKWNTMLPSGISPPGGPTGEAGTIFSATSMTHQLHCLFMMGRIFATLSSSSSSSANANAQPLDDGLHTHFLHCIDYLRQATMCAGDVALEPHSASDGADLGPLDGGWNGIHVCKNYNEVKEYLQSGIRSGTRVVLPIDD